MSSSFSSVSKPASSTSSQAQRLESLTDVIHFLHARGWTPATSSNFSCRLPVGQTGFSISVSGLDKGTFSAQDFLDVDFNGQVIRPEQAHLRPSAETLLHALVYQQFPTAQVVLHTHSVNGTVLSKLYEASHGLCLKDFEVLKGLEGIRTHQTELWLPIFGNHQDMTVLAAQIEPVLREQKPVYGFLLAGHGLYTWGDTLAQAKRHVEVFEFLFECILKLRSHGYSDYS
ncbi:methylthioribulose-1-phosphate dehydratase [Microcystis phage MaAM05]|nr:methylthioribulose-1-phosphate dehydratase [Microcystis phage MaAM05]